MNRSDLQLLTQLRVQDAWALMAAGSHSGAYYLAGYIVECALKACIAKKTNQYDFPDKRRAEASYSHRPLDLVRVAELEADLDAELRRNPAFALNWRNVLAWSEVARYETKTQVEAQTLYDAIMDGTNGVLQWVSRYW